jgi:hypothetical protein
MNYATGKKQDILCFICCNLENYLLLAEWISNIENTDCLFYGDLNKQCIGKHQSNIISKYSMTRLMHTTKSSRVRNIKYYCTYFFFKQNK